jgi:hypothetical protein
VVSRRAAAFGIASFTVGCVRYEYVAPDCGPSISDGGHSQIAWQHAGPPNSIVGHVVRLPDGAPVLGAVVHVRGRNNQATDASGNMQFLNVPRGADTLTVRVLGYTMASAAVELRADSGIVFIAVMEPRPIVLDGCGYVLEMRRKPWWKFW